MHVNAIAKLLLCFTSVMLGLLYVLYCNVLALGLCLLIICASTRSLLFVFSLINTCTCIRLPIPDRKLDLNMDAACSLNFYQEQTAQNHLIMEQQWPPDRLDAILKQLGLVRSLLKVLWGGYKLCVSQTQLAEHGLLHGRALARGQQGGFSKQAKARDLQDSLSNQAQARGRWGGLSGQDQVRGGSVTSLQVSATKWPTKTTLPIIPGTSHDQFTILTDHWYQFLVALITVLTLFKFWFPFVSLSILCCVSFWLCLV